MIDVVLWIAALLAALGLIGLAEILAVMVAQTIVTRRALRRRERRPGYVPFVR